MPKARAPLANAAHSTVISATLVRRPARPSSPTNQVCAHQRLVLLHRPDPFLAKAALLQNVHTHREAWQSHQTYVASFAQEERLTGTRRGCADLVQTWSSSFRSGIRLRPSVVMSSGVSRP